ncbi:MAG: 30S ribosomal protein S20 [Clostridia bacterium]|nr:30S ribosomal protein S20 [Clostridia bacterium]MBQ7491498.1 30S ribosomal protein S20 [Clostridia bacterium]MBR5390748.1 30S ribosomal protein S20 [Clostridia bacterium]
MPNIKSAKKRVLVSKLNNAKNRAAKTELKTNVKKFDAAVAAGDDVQAAYKTAVKNIDQAAAKGIIHKNTAARKKSQLTKKLNNAQ